MVRRWRPREPFCGWSHLCGAVLSVVGLLVLLSLSRGKPWHLTGFAIYGGSLILLYLASTLYHSVPTTPDRVERLRQFDHMAIFLLIAGTYAPLCLVPLRGALGWTLLGIQYGAAFLGISAILFRRHFPEALRVVLYICMGWLAVVALKPLGQALAPDAITWLVGGGLLYSLGAVILITDRPHLWPGRFSAHDLWHLFVLGGSACHFVLMLRFVA